MKLLVCFQSIHVTKKRNTSNRVPSWCGFLLHCLLSEPTFALGHPTTASHMAELSASMALAPPLVRCPKHHIRTVSTQPVQQDMGLKRRWNESGLQTLPKEVTAGTSSFWRNEEPKSVRSVCLFGWKPSRPGLKAGSSRSVRSICKVGLKSEAYRDFWVNMCVMAL